MQSGLGYRYCSSFQSAARLCIFRRLPTLVKSIAVTRLKEYLETGFLAPFMAVSAAGFSDVEHQTMIEAALAGLEESLKLSDPPETVTLLLWKTLDAVYRLVPNDNLVGKLSAICKTHIQFQILYFVMHIKL